MPNTTTAATPTQTSESRQNGTDHLEEFFARYRCLHSRNDTDEFDSPDTNLPELKRESTPKTVSKMPNKEATANRGIMHDEVKLRSGVKLYLSNDKKGANGDDDEANSNDDCDVLKVL